MKRMAHTEIIHSTVSLSLHLIEFTIRASTVDISNITQEWNARTMKSGCDGALTCT
jgi:hypothetical protein